MLPRRANSLLYHDVIPVGSSSDASGFSGAIASRYKLDEGLFRAHLQAIAQRQLICLNSVFDGEQSGRTPFLLTFDDGGESFLRPIADLLEERNWRGHFFISTQYLNTPGFLTSQDLCELHRRGHVIGSHTVSHPLRISQLSRAEIDREWRASRDTLEQILGTRIVSASIPCGDISPAVIQSAAAQGLRVVFTSEPTSQIRTADNCTLIGRYAIVDSTPARVAAALAAGAASACWRQAATWTLKRTAKSLLGNSYRRASETLWQLRTRPAAR